MKNLFKNKTIGYLLFAGLLSFQVACSTSERPQGSNASDVAFTDFQDYVTRVENSSNGGRTDSTSIQTASSNARVEYDEKIAMIDRYHRDYDESRHQEIEDLKTRYNNYWDKQVSRQNAQLAAKAASATAVSTDNFSTAGLETKTAADIRLTYENLITHIQANKDSYTKEDWKAINDYYLSLDSRKNAVQNQLNDKDKYEIGKAKAKYISLRTASRFDPDVSETANDVSNSLNSAGNKIENKAEKVGSDVKDATKSGVHKAGHAAEKVGSEIKSTTKKTVNKVENKMD